MSELDEQDQDKVLFEDSEIREKHRKSRDEKKRNHSDNKDTEESAENDHSEDEDKDNREASFFGRLRRKDKEPTDTESLWGDIEKEKKAPKGLTEFEVQEAVGAITDGLSRELRNEFEQATESSIAELELVAVAAFVDSLNEKVEAGRDITEDLLNEALREALEDLLGTHEDDVDAGNTTNGGSGSGSSGGSSLSSGNIHSFANVSNSVSAFIAANVGVVNKMDDEESNRGKGLLIGGIVGYIVGRRHGRKRAEAKLQPEINKLEGQISELYNAIDSRERLIRQVVRELATRQLDGQQSAKLALINENQSELSSQKNRNASRSVKPKSLAVPVIFATLLVSKRLMADVSKEDNTWGKDLLVGGVAGYMVGRRHGRKRTETRIKSDLEMLEDQVSGLKEDLADKDTVMDAMILVSAEANHAISHHEDEKELNVRTDKVIEPIEIRKSQVGNKEKQLVDASIDRIVVSRKHREIKKHKKQLIMSGKATSVGELNLASSVFIERRLMDGTENNAARKQIESMDEAELLAMSRNIYVDGESVIDLYLKDRVDLEVLRKSVEQYWRKTGDYEQTLRTKLKKDESAVNDIRENLEEAYRSILNNI